MYIYFNLDLVFHLETSKNNKWNINQIFIKHWLLFFFTIMKAIFQVHKINNNYSNKTVVDHSEAASGLDVVCLVTQEAGFCQPGETIIFVKCF